MKMIEANLGDVKLKYNEEDFNRKIANSYSIKVSLFIGITFIIAMVIGITGLMKIENCIPDVLVVLIEAIYVIAVIGGIVYVVIKKFPTNYVPAFDTIEWLIRQKEIEAGYFKERLMFYMPNASSNHFFSFKYVINGIKKEYKPTIITDENIDKAKPIEVIFDFCDQNSYVITIKNK